MYRKITYFASVFFRALHFSRQNLLPRLIKYDPMPWKFCQGEAVKHNALSSKEVCNVIMMT